MFYQKNRVMNDLRIFIVASSGTLLTQMAQGEMPVIGPELDAWLTKTLISVVGGIVSTLAYKLLSDWMGKGRLFGKRRMLNSKKN